MEKISGIYCIENLINGKKYIGQAVNIKKRIIRHFRELKYGYHNNSYLQRSYDKYGKEAFKIWIVQECEKNQEILNLMEIYWIIFYDSYIEFERGYNLNFGGSGVLGNIPWNKGIVYTDEQRKNMKGCVGDGPWKGKTIPPELIEKRSRGTRGRKQKDCITSKYFGVYFDKARNRWTARISYNKKLKFLGRYEKEIDAALRYNQAVIELYNGTLPLNIIENKEENL